MTATKLTEVALEGAAAWGHHSLAPGAEARLDVGPLQLRLRSQSEELWIADASQGQGGVGYPEAAADDEPDHWTRWASPGVTDVVIQPALADRPVVVAPEVEFRLTPGAHARIYVRIPLWVRISFAENPDVPLYEAPTYVMSDTWWGDFGSGELAYWLPTKARRQVADDLFEPHVVMCPLELVNESAEVLPVEKLAVRVQHMPIFRQGKKLWSAETTVHYEAGEEGSRLDIADRPPSEAEGAELVTAPRERPDRGFRARTFGRFKLLPGS